jgi:hypothetical protein
MGHKVNQSASPEQEAAMKKFYEWLKDTEYRDKYEDELDWIFLEVDDNGN